MLKDIRAILLVAALSSIAFLTLFFSPVYNDPTTPMLYYNFPCQNVIFWSTWIAHYFTCIIPSKQICELFLELARTDLKPTVLQHYGLTLRYFGERLPAIFGYKADTKEFQLRYTAGDFRKALITHFDALKEFAVQEWTVCNVSTLQTES